VTDVGPKPFQRPLLISLSFSSPVFSSTTVVTVDIGFALKLKKMPNHDRRTQKINMCFDRDPGHVLVVLGYALSAENGRREEAKIARVLGLGVRAPDELRVDIDVHGGWIFGGVVLCFLRETVPADALHYHRSESSDTRKRAREKKDWEGGKGY
jgi:hypothetical protein